ncbi:hypothetical protein D3C86_2181610 [compost metagenome]
MGTRRTKRFLRKLSTSANPAAWHMRSLRVERRISPLASRSSTWRMARIRSFMRRTSWKFWIK